MEIRAKLTRDHFARTPPFFSGNRCAPEECAKHFRLHLRTFCTRSRQEEEWEVIYRPVNYSRERAQNVLALILHGLLFFLEIEMRKRNVRSGFRLHSRFSRSEASFLFFFAVFHQIHQEIGGLVAVTFAPCCLTSHLLTGTAP